CCFTANSFIHSFHYGCSSIASGGVLCLLPICRGQNLVPFVFNSRWLVDHTGAGVWLWLIHGNTNNQHKFICADAYGRICTFCPFSGNICESTYRAISKTGPA